MALLFMEGFEGSGDMMWDTFSPVTTASGVTPRTGTHFGSWSGAQTRAVAGFTPSTTLIVGFALYVPSYSTATGTRFPGFYTDTGVTLHTAVGFNTTGNLVARRSTTDLATSTQIFPTNAWKYVEVKSTVHDTTGNIQVRVDGVEWINYTGDTRNAGTSMLIDRVTFVGSAVTVYIDDIYICNDQGTTNNNFLGDVKVETLYPNANGASSQWVGSDGNSVDNYALVDENPANTTDYVASSTIGNRDLYEFGNLQTLVGQVFGVQPTYYAQKSDAGAASIIDLARAADGTIDIGATKQPSTSWLGHSGKLRETKPGGGAWTIADVNAAQFGVEVA